jgi:signal recognition particle receptor subunit beta
MRKSQANYKIIFAGPVGAGKTTAVASLSDIAPVRTDRVATDMASERKPETTVAMDYGLMNLADGVSIHLYGTPGQERFDFMWDILVEGGIGLVLLIDNTRPDPFQDLRFFLNAFKSFISRTGVVIGVTRTDIRSSPTLDDYYRELEQMKIPLPPTFEVDARERKDVSLLVEALLCSLDPTMAET